MDFKKKERAKEVAELEAKKESLEEHNVAILETSEKWLGELENLEQEIHSAQEIREEADKKVEVAKKEAARYEKKLAEIAPMVKDMERFAVKYSYDPEEEEPEEEPEEEEYIPPKKTGIFGKSKEAPKKPAADREKPKTPLKEEAAEEVVPEDYDDKEEMDPDEFAQYACKYASEIDCSITGKSLLALYERIEMMEEDEVRLTKAAAVDLIEEAADKAEKKSLGKKIAGLFSPTYTKEGLLILHEKDFFD